MTLEDGDRVPDGQATVGALLRSTAPDRLPEVTAQHLRDHYAADRVEVLLADLNNVTLRPVLNPQGANGGGAERRCYGSQQPLIDNPTPGTTRVLLPLTVWGDRLGVLRLETPDPAGPRLTAELSGLAGLAGDLAMALRTADHDTDRYHQVRRGQRLTMAAELQWALLPGRSLDGDQFQLAGALEPAYAVYGDHYDWAVTGGRLTITVLNGHGDGIEAAVLTTTAVNAMRNARRSGSNIVEQAELASDAVWSRYGGNAHVATVLLEIDLSGGSVAAVDAGSPRAMIANPGGVRTVALEQQLPLGMFGDTRYDIQQFQLEPADRLLIASDGMHAATPAGKPPYGQSALFTALRRTKLQPPAEAVGTVVRGLRDYHGEVEAEDDAVLVCLDWLGRSA